MRRYFVMTEDGVGPDSLEAALKTEKKRLIDLYDSKLQVDYSKGAKFETKDEEKEFYKDKKATVDEHRKLLQLGLKRFVFGKVAADFYKFKDRVVDGKAWMNPWDPVLRDTMFWM
jgi:hypothetical protein